MTRERYRRDAAQMSKIVLPSPPSRARPGAALNALPRQYETLAKCCAYGQPPKRPSGPQSFFDNRKLALVDEYQPYVDDMFIHRITTHRLGTYFCV
jgi:hypothetical protein